MDIKIVKIKAIYGPIKLQIGEEENSKLNVKMAAISHRCLIVAEYTRTDLKDKRMQPKIDVVFSWNLAELNIQPETTDLATINS